MTEEITIKKGEGNALVIVDGQNDFILESGALYVAGVEGELTNEEIIDRINALGGKSFDYLAATEDEHPENHVEFGIFGKHCATGESGQMYHPSLWQLYEAADEHIEKGQDAAVISYSIVTSRKFARHIANLRKWGIRRIFVAGWAYTHCVGETAIAYACQGFEVYVVRDATRSVPPPYGNRTLMAEKLGLYGVKTILCENIN